MLKTADQVGEPDFQWRGPFYHRSRETDRLRRAAVSWWLTKPEEVSFLFDPGCIASAGRDGGTVAPGPKVDLDQAGDEQLRNLAAIAELLDDQEEEDDGGKSKHDDDEDEEGEEDAADWATVGAQLIRRAEKASRCRRRGGEGDWMSRYAGDHLGRSGDEADDIEGDGVAVPEEDGDDDDAASSERLQRLLDRHLCQSYPHVDGDFSNKYRKWSAAAAACDQQ